MSGVRSVDGRARGTDLRLARLHLRCGSHALARAELETLAGSDGLDREGVLDLAEVRWRTGDLQGASAAASAWLDDANGGYEPGAILARVIAAEAAADRGALEESATLVEAAAADLGERGALDELLAGIVVRAAWPWDDPPAGSTHADPTAANPAPEPGLAPVARVDPGARGAPVAPVVPGAAVTAASLGPARAPAAEPAALDVAPAAADLVRAGSELVAAAPERAAILLALAMRADPAAAGPVLEALDAAATTHPEGTGTGEHPTTPGGPPPSAPVPAALAFVRGEALRALGRHEEARIAYASAGQLALEPAQPDPPRSST